ASHVVSRCCFAICCVSDRYTAASPTAAAPPKLVAHGNRSRKNFLPGGISFSFTIRIY
ncbi:hypothetical protein A2U01_0054945, partial [Trifolium medium]|nr:hypothetical protein [Trifolium medium]